jgi:hypothetical protein
MPDVEHLPAEYPGSENEGDKYAPCPEDEDFFKTIQDAETMEEEQSTSLWRA